MASIHIDHVLDIEHKTGGTMDNITSTIMRITAADAFRKYQWFRNIPVENSSGNYRGMVLNARGRVVYKMTSKLQNAASNVAILATLAQESIKSKSEIQNILKSTDRWDIKGPRLSCQVSAICLRVLYGELIEGPVNSAFWLARQMSALSPAYGIRQAVFNQAIDKAEAKMRHVTSTWQGFASGDVLYYLIQTTIG